MASHDEPTAFTTTDGATADATAPDGAAGETAPAAPRAARKRATKKAAAHARDCVRLNLDLPALRTDVDDDQALRRAVTIGVGRHTAAVLHLTLD
ncbi:MAG: hypothetical protein ABI131_03455 [Nostocoides sp.]